MKHNYALVQSACVFYGFTTETTSRLLEMVDQSDQEEWYEKYRPDIAPWLVQLLDLEAMADRIRIFATLVPGVCQVPGYAEALGAMNLEHIDDPSYARRLAEIRAQRARRVFGRKGVTVSIMLDEGALLRQVGGAEVMAEQLQHLRGLATRPNVEISVLPFSRGAVAATKGAFNILEFDQPEEPDLIYMENYIGAQYSVKGSVLNELRSAMTACCLRPFNSGSTNHEH
ncbi:hypothetical protein KIH74_11180 [Kineosporia sp. J2-2]|uniref:DUF5753 domain-containing protein n=1 Tax=Kineosporia corallincola TaxID=2835133 RepID=A0ABS5TEJ4_9ACTN|nr:DUF5753 domain-containing protein [Kineosporia corallincola]MBT0769486.1 hypothetical protein [Kineosporia corallincola]